MALFSTLIKQLKKKRNTRTRLVIFHGFLDAKYEFCFQIASARHNYKKLVIKVSKKAYFYIFCHIITTIYDNIRVEKFYSNQNYT